MYRVQARFDYLKDVEFLDHHFGLGPSHLAYAFQALDADSVATTLAVQSFDPNLASIYQPGQVFTYTDSFGSWYQRQSVLDVKDRSTVQGGEGVIGVFGAITTIEEAFLAYPFAPHATVPDVVRGQPFDDVAKDAIR